MQNLDLNLQSSAQQKKGAAKISRKKLSLIEAHIEQNEKMVDLLSKQRVANVRMLIRICRGEEINKEVPTINQRLKCFTMLEGMYQDILAVVKEDMEVEDTSHLKSVPEIEDKPADVIQATFIPKGL